MYKNIEGNIYLALLLCLLDIDNLELLYLFLNTFEI